VVLAGYADRCPASVGVPVSARGKQRDARSASPTPEALDDSKIRAYHALSASQGPAFPLSCRLAEFVGPSRFRGPTNSARREIGSQPPSCTCRSPIACRIVRFRGPSRRRRAPRRERRDSERCDRRCDGERVRAKRASWPRPIRCRRALVRLALRLPTGATKAEHDAGQKALPSRSVDCCLMESSQHD
jgi:hypothetical protein